MWDSTYSRIITLPSARRVIAIQLASIAFVDVTLNLSRWCDQFEGAKLINAAHAVIGVIVGLALLGLPLSIITTFLAMGSSGADSFFYGWGGAAIIGGILGAFASRPAKIFRYIFIFGAVLILLVPLATWLGPTIAVANLGAAAVPGPALGAGLGSLVIGFFAVFVAVAYLIVGLLIGRDKKVVAMPVPEIPTQFARTAPPIALQPVPDHYATLGVLRNAHQHDIDDASKRSIDTVRAAVSAGDPTAAEKLARLHVAMEILRDPVRRAKYHTEFLAESRRSE